MAMPTGAPEFLFRFWNAKSTGRNTTLSFDPAGDISNTSPALRGSLLRSVLLGQNSKPPFITFYDSLLQALIHAGHCQQQGQRDIQLTCIRTNTAKTPAGARAQFKRLDDLVRDWKANVRDGTGESIHSYPGKWVAVTPVLLGAGSCTVAFDTLLQQGLYDLYPAFQEIRAVKEMRGPYEAVALLRLFNFGWERPVTQESMDVAARLALSFRSSLPNDDALPFTTSNLVAWIVSLQKRSPTDRGLRQWIYTRLQRPPVSTGAQSTAANSSDFPEIGQYLELARHFSGKALTTTASSKSLGPATIDAARDEWQLWRSSGRTARAAEPPALKPEKVDRPYDGGYTQGYQLTRKNIPLWDKPKYNQERAYYRRHNSQLREEKVGDSLLAVEW